MHIYGQKACEREYLDIDLKKKKIPNNIYLYCPQISSIDSG